ncbi:hypothetical protein M2401_000765 [Pseudomonas sp. JUb42]|uniref:DUF7079 family protein n=1 Tax=Pseudomonas sp. JUb42 TaxID=2940611 RepID=UPI00216AAE07|nr:hypothetical protein [Pseudomonas sp. JUb42]MCS3467044.1 hypothetical protein [Pseudomonas sp. JUb42]
MGSKLSAQKLWAALSYVFVDNETDYQYIASIAKNYPVDDVEFALFERVAPVCIYNGMTPAPPICWYFDEEELVADIESLIARRAKYGVVAKSICVIGGWFIRLVYRKVWAEIKAEIVKAQSNN